MRTLFALRLALVMPARKHRREPIRETRQLESVPIRCRRLQESAQLVGEEAAVIWPYVIAWEREQERRRQRGRRRAALLARMGQTYARGAA
jgi:hypothetical protein